MSLAGLHDDRHLAAELLVAFFRDSRLAIKPGVKLPAHMQDWHARFGQRRRRPRRRREEDNETMVFAL
jgi:hypothetical protein